MEKVVILTIELESLVMFDLEDLSRRLFLIGGGNYPNINLKNNIK